MRPTREQLLEMFDYNPASGLLINRTNRRQYNDIGKIAGHLREDGYRTIGIKNKIYLSTHIIWMIMTGNWPVGEIDHIDTYGPKADWGDRWSNLREIPHYKNSMNSIKMKNNVSGHTGVYEFKHKTIKNKKWCAQINANGNRVYLGIFPTIEEAIAARKDAEILYFGEFRPRES